MYRSELPSGSAAHHNYDFSGNVIFNVPLSQVEFVPGNGEMRQVSIPFGDLASLGADCVRNHRIAKLEQMDDDELLGSTRTS